MKQSYFRGLDVWTLMSLIRCCLSLDSTSYISSWLLGIRALEWQSVFE